MVNVPPENQQSKFMKNSKKFYKNPKASRPYFQQNAEEMVSAESHGENSSLAETSAPPAIAIVAPTARNPPNHSIISMNSSAQPCKAHVGAPPPMSRTMHVQHHIHHIQPVQISTALSPPPPPTQNQVTAPVSTVHLSQPPPPGATVWPPVEPAFHFGPGFEVHHSYCPTHSRPHADQHIVMFYLSAGVAASFQTASGHKILQGPVTVPMVSQSGSPPIPMPVQVPPGHVMQQIVDENGTLRHVILSTQHQQLQGGVQGVQHHIHGHYIANGSASHFYNPIAGYPPANPNQAPGSTNQLYPTMNHQQAQQIPHSPSPPNNNSHSISNNNYQNNERAQRQYNKLLRKLESRNVTGSQVHSQTTRNNKNENLNGTSVARRTLQRNGTNSGGGASSVGTSDDGEESSSVPDEEDDFSHQLSIYLSSIEPPMVKEIQSHTALITWEAPPAPTENALNSLNTNDIRYEILLGDRGKDGKYKSIFRGTNLSCRIQDLRAGQEYHVCLAAHLDDVHGETTDPVLFKTPAREPDTPSAPKVIAKTKNSMQLRWNAPIDNGSHIVHYSLEMRADGERDFSELVKTKGKQFSVQKLAPATCYTFRLSAVNDFGRSEFSEPISYVTDGYPPSQPLPPTVANVSTSSITLQWFRRREDGDFCLQMSNQGAQGYMNVYYGPDIMHECPRLQRATSYQFRLGSKTESGQSPWSEEIAVVTLPEQPGRPSKPQVKGKIHAQNFKVKWDPPHDRGGADIKLYHLEINSGAIFERVYSGAASEATCERLNPGTTYQVRVLCEGPGGYSGPSEISTITTEAIVPNPPQTPYYSNLPGPYAAVLQWEKPLYQGGAPVNEYELEIEGILNDGAERTKQRVMAYKGKEAYCVVKDLLPGEAYTTHVRAVNRIGAGEWSNEFSFSAGSAPPSKMLAPEVSVRSPTNLMVQWREPQTNGAPILDYKLESAANQEDEAFSLVYSGPETKADLKDLLPFTTYFFRVHAVNTSGRSPNSSITAQQTPAAVPSMPALLPELFAITSSSAHIYWKEPTANGDPIVRYVIECGDRQLSTESSRTEILVEHLNPEQMYKVKVQAVNSIGAGAFTQSHKITTKPLPPKAPRLECIQYSYNSLRLKWGNDAQASSKSANLMDFQRFEVEMKIKSSSKDYSNVYAGTRNCIKVQKLHESTVYAFRICAQTDHAGVGAWSDEYLFKTQAAQPNGVKLIRCNDLNNASDSNVEVQPALMIEWQHSKNSHFNDAIEYILQKALTPSGNSKNVSFDEIYRGPETRFTYENADFDIDYTFRVIPVRVMKSRRTTSVCSTSTRTSSDEVDGGRSSDESDESDDEKEAISDMPVTFEYVQGPPSSVLHFKLSKTTEPVVVATNVSSQTKKSTKTSSKAQSQVNAAKKNQHQPQHQLHESTSDSSSDESTSMKIESVNQSLFLKLLNTIREFFNNRKNWTVTEESIIIWLGFMIFAIVVGCILHFVMS